MVELLIALVIMSTVMGAMVSVLRSQSLGFRKGGASMDLNQNARYAMSTLERVIRTAGSGTATSQPMLIYADTSVIAFNSNFATDVADGLAVYVNPNLPATAIDAITTATPITIPNSAVVYPTMNYFWSGPTPSRAETIIFYFRPDSSTADPSDFVLFQQVNNTRPELVAKNIRHWSGRPFFQYWSDNTTNLGVTSIQAVAAGRLPIQHTAPAHGSTADTAASALTDSVRAMRVNMVVTNGLTNSDSTSRQFSTMIYIPNNGLAQPTTCGDVPLNGSSLVVTSPSAGSVSLTWVSSPDELSGERDVSGYNLYYRLQPATVWETWRSQAAGQATYTVTGSGFPPGTYDFGVSAQDCTPQESTTPLTATVVIP
jgi:hypothetical protein